MNVIVTGADGFIGRALVARLLSGADRALAGAPISRLSLLDRHFTTHASDPCVRQLPGDFGDQRVLAQALEGGADLVFHLASIPGGAAARDFELGLRVNLQATIALLEALRHQGRRPTIVFASSVAVYGVPLPPLIDEDTLPQPSMSYGAHKLIGEILIRDYSERQFIDGRALRLPGIVSRPPQPSGLLSQFLSDLIRELSAGRDVTCPVSPGGKSWWMSRPCVVDNLLHAAALPAASVAQRRVWLLPVLHASMEEVVAAIARTRGKEVLQRVRYTPDPALEAQFASLPPLHCPKALAAGFRHDGTLEVLVRRALEECR
jgi:nucleoside-diphosphate-sugar epimerase